MVLIPLNRVVLLNILFTLIVGIVAKVLIPLNRVVLLNLTDKLNIEKEKVVLIPLNRVVLLNEKARWQQIMKEMS